MDNLKFIITDKDNKYGIYQLKLGRNTFLGSGIEILTKSTINDKHYIQGDYIWLVTIPSDATAVDNKTNMVELIYREYLGDPETYENFSLPLPSVDVCRKHNFDKILDKSRNIECLSKKMLDHVKLHDTLFVKGLIEEGANVNYAGSFNYTALHWAAHYGYVDMVKLLLNKGANVNILSDFGKTPLDFAKERYFYSLTPDYKYLDVIALLEERMNIPGKKDKNDFNKQLDKTDLNKQLLEAVKNQNLSDVKRLLADGADVNTARSNGETPLHTTVRNGNLEITRVLLEKGANVASEDEYFHTPLYIAACYGHCDIGQLLLDNGADVNVKDDYLWTPLHAAASEGHDAMVQLLLDNGADINSKTDSDDTALDFANEGCYHKVVTILEEYIKKKNEPENPENKDVASDIDVEALLLSFVKNNCYEEVCGTMLNTAAEIGDSKIAEIVLKTNIDISHKNSALETAAEHKHYDICKMIIKTGVNPKFLGKKLLAEILLQCD